MLKLVGHAHSHFLPRFSIQNATRSFSSYKFRYHLQKKLDHDPDYSLHSIFKEIRRTAPGVSQPASVYEAAFEVLVRNKRFEDGATVLLNMKKKGLLASHITQAKMMALSLTMELPDEVGVENVINNICDIVAHMKFTEPNLLDLIRSMALYRVDRGIVAEIVTDFVESRGRMYTPPPNLVPEVVEAFVREGKLQKAFATLEQVSATDVPERVELLSDAYRHLLSALRDTCEWNAPVADRIMQGIEERKVPKQPQLTLLLAWAARQEKYLSVLHFYNLITTDYTADIDVYRILFEMHMTFTFTSALPQFAPIAPRKLYHDMTSTAKPGIYDLTIALTAFMHNRDYAAALVVLEAYARYEIPLDNATFYNVVKPLTHRMWADIANKRRVREGQIKWGDRFLGVKFNQVRLSGAVISEYLDKVSRERFSVRDPLYSPPPPRAKGSWETTAKAKEQARRAKWGPVKYAVPTMQEMETVDLEPVVDPNLAYNATPLVRLVRRAVFAQAMLNEDLDEERAEERVWAAEHQAQEEMIHGRSEETRKEDAEHAGETQTEQFQPTPQIPKVAVRAS